MKNTISLADFFDYLDVKCHAYAFFDVKLFRETYKKGLQAKEKAHDDFIKKIKAKNNPEILDFYEDSDELIHSYDDIFDQLCVIGLYISLETFLKYLLKQHWKYNTTKDNFCSLLKKYKEQNIDLETIGSYKNINKLRLFNNCIKHKDCHVSSDLSKEYPEYQTGNKLKIIESDIQSFSESTKEFRLELFKLVYGNIQ